MNIAVVGTGYVGLVSGCGFAEMGNQVTCVDIDESKVRRLQAGEMTIYEPGLEVLLQRNTKEGRLEFTTELAPAVRAAEVIFIAVGTPPDEDGTADLRHVMEVAKGIAASANGYKVVVVKSTVPVGSCTRVREVIGAGTDLEFDVVSNPEFLKEGAAVDDFMYPDRIVVGTDREKPRKIMEELYAPFVRTGSPVIFTTVRSSEMIKYAANAMLATRISFMNDIAKLCDEVGADVSEVRRGMGTDPRIGPKFLFPGVGYGGSCFPKDVKALVATGREHGVPMRVLEAVEDVNEEQKHLLVKKILAHFGGSVAGRTIAVWGLSFKPKTDDMREAPSLVIIPGLLKLGATVKAFDPVATEEASKLLPAEVSFESSYYDTLTGADALAVVTEWNEFRNPDFDRMKSLMAGHVVFDGRNIFEPAKMAEMGFAYYGIGRG